MLLLAPRLLENLAELGADDGVGGDDERGLAFGGVDGRFVDVERFLLRRFEYVFEGCEGFAFVFGDGGGDDFEVGQADLAEVVRAGVWRRARWVLTCARSWRRRGDAEARITLFPRIMFSAGRSSGRGRGGAVEPACAGLVGVTWDALS